MAYSIDTRTIQPGDIFIPVKGANFDGHNFIEQALSKGASQVLDVDLAQFAAEHRKKFNIPVIGVTGSAGKTTTKDLLATVLSQKFKVIKSAQNQNNEVGVPLTLLKIEQDTEIAIVEMAMRGRGQIEELANIAEPTHGIITNIGVAHIELLHSRQAIALAKSEIMRKGMKVFLNKRDDYYDFLVEQANSLDAIVVPFEYANITEANHACVTQVALDFGLTVQEIEQGFAQYQGSDHRLLVKQNKPKGYVVIDDSYNANPDAVIFALEYLREVAGNKRTVAVLGDMKELGDHSIVLHQNIPTAKLDLVITYGELAKHIPNHKNFEVNQRGELIQYLTNTLKQGDVVLVKGSRSMQMEQIVEALMQNG